MPEPAKANPFDPNQPFDLGLLPGSRPAELRKHLPLMIRSASRIAERFPEARFLIPVAEGVKASQIVDILEKSGGIRLDAAYASEDLELLLETRPLAVGIATGTHEVILVRDRDYSYRRNMAFAVTKSGTSTLENAILGIPMIVFYKTTFITYTLAKRLIKIDHIGLVNVVAEHKIVPELIQKEANPSRIALETTRILENETLYRKMRSDLAEVRSRLGEKGACHRSAEAVLEIARGKGRTAGN
jgi:lipid-A-disaccharide synthase